MKKIFICIALLIFFSQLQAQTNFFGTVKIEFQKTVYARQLYKEMFQQWYDMFKDRVPAQVVSYFDFIGDTAKSIFKPGKEAPFDPKSFYNAVADKNVVYTDYKSQKITAQKPVYEETFLVEDSLLKIKWKLVPDTRVIAGYECRKAVGIIDDSIGVIAFYTDEILIKGGPESIGGLPGMILGLSVPRLHTTWIATGVQVNGINMNPVTPPSSKGKKVTRGSMVGQLEKVLKNWGAYGQKMIVNFLI
ncbi:MAG TPA: GLPGLI family protein [Chitinophagaceae bacterium]|jgi:GLPGLI family protein|nr:GLPGLI family protein [Chitinophagaceae bacterium]